MTIKWPEGTPDDVRRVADELAAVLKGRNGREVGPAISLVFSYVIAELGSAPLGQVIDDVISLAQRYGALKSRCTVN